MFYKSTDNYCMYFIGISTPMYAALLPAGSDSPRGKFLGERKVIPWNADKDAALQVMDNVFMTYIGLG